MPIRTPPDGITFVHTADWQLGKPFAGITDPAKRARVQQERFEAVRRIAQVARDHRATCVLVAGDLFDSPTPTHAVISAALGLIGEFGLPTFAIPGNHDHGGPDSLWEQAFFRREASRLAPNFHLLDRSQPHVVSASDLPGARCGLVLLPCPLTRRREPDDPTAWIRALDFGDFSDVGESPRVVIAHGSTAVFTARSDNDADDLSGPANTIALERLPIEALDYVALGDWHGFQQVGQKAWYSGTPEVDRFPKEGQEPGHVAVVTVTRGADPRVTASRTGSFRWLSRAFDLDASLPCASEGEHGPVHIDRWLTDATQPQAEGEPSFDGCLARLHLTGTVSLAGREELDRLAESWQARLLRLDLVDDVRLAPATDELTDLTARPDDPIIARVAAALLRRLENPSPADDPDVVRRAIHLLHGLVGRHTPSIPRPRPSTPR